MLHTRFYPSVVKSRWPAVFLAFSWILGLVLGAAFSFAAIDIISSLMRAAVIYRVSIFGLAVNVTFPLLICLLAVYRLPFVFYYLIAFLKAFVFGCCLIGIYLVYGTAGWLIHFFLTFSETYTVVPFLWFSFRCIDGQFSAVKRDFYICIVLYLAVGVIDYFLVSPYFAYLITIR